MNELPEQDQASEELPSPDTEDSTEASHPHLPQVDQAVKGDRNQTVGQMSGGTAIGNVQGTVFNISGSNITNLTGEGDINYQEAPKKIRSLNQVPEKHTSISYVKDANNGSKCDD